MITKIEYQNKEGINTISVPAKNQVTDDDMNSIKSVVNNNADILKDTNDDVEEFINSANSRIGTMEATTEGLETRMQTAEGEIDELQANTYNKTEVNTLLEPKANRSEIPTDLSQLSNANTKFVNETQLNNVDNNLQNQIDAIVASSDVVDIVGTYQELQNYDTSKLGDNDIVKVLEDSTHNNATSYFRWKKTQSTWQYIGSEGPYYTKSETNNLLDDKVDKVAGKGLSENDFTNALKTKLEGIQAGAQVNTVTGVKGDSETNYRTGNINITKANIGLGNVDNTSDLNKPISNAVQNALNGKVDTTAIVSSVSASSTNEQAPGAKLFYDTVGDIETILHRLNVGSGVE